MNKLEKYQWKKYPKEYTKKTKRRTEDWMKWKEPSLFLFLLLLLRFFPKSSRFIFRILSSGLHSIYCSFSSLFLFICFAFSKALLCWWRCATTHQQQKKKSFFTNICKLHFPKKYQKKDDDGDGGDGKDAAVVVVMIKKQKKEFKKIEK